MAAGVAIVNPERSLEDEIFQVMEEAALLYAEGRHMEAGTLIEKAQAMRTVEIAQETTPAESGDGFGSEAVVGGADEDVIADLVGNLAKGLAEVLVGAIRGLEKRIASETRALGSSFQQRLDRLQTSVDDLRQLRDRIGRLTEFADEQKAASAASHERCEHLAAASESLRQAEQRHGAELRDLRAQFEQFSSSTSRRLDAVCSRLGVQQEELAALQTSVLGVSSRVAALVDRLDRQADVIRTMYEGQTLRQTVLDEVLGALDRLKAGTPASCVPADQL